MDDKKQTRVVIYCRTSTTDQKISLQAQRDKATAYCALYDLEVVSVLEEQASGKSLKRPLLQSALGMLKSGQISAIVVVKLDRLSRSVKDLGSLVEDYFSSGKWSLYSVGEQLNTSSANGRLVLHILGACAQAERENLSERTSAALQQLKKQGKRVSGIAPYGWRFTAGGKLKRQEQEQAVISKALELRAADRSAHWVAKRLVELGFRNRRLGVFTSKAVLSMLAKAA